MQKLLRIMKKCIISVEHLLFSSFSHPQTPRLVLFQFTGFHAFDTVNTGFWGRDWRPQNTSETIKQA